LRARTPHACTFRWPPGYSQGSCCCLSAAPLPGPWSACQRPHRFEQIVAAHASGNDAGYARAGPAGRAVHQRRPLPNARHVGYPSFAAPELCPPSRASLPPAFPAALPAGLYVTMLISRNMMAHAILKRSVDAKWSEVTREKQNESRKMRWGASFDSLRGNESNSIMIKKFSASCLCDSQPQINTILKCVLTNKQVPLKNKVPF